MAIDSKKITDRRKGTINIAADQIITTTIGHAFVELLSSGVDPTVDNIIVYFRDRISKKDQTKGETALIDAALHYLEGKSQPHK